MPSNRTETEEVPTQTLILDAAERLLAQIGYRKMTMDDIAKEAGISRRTVYGYFNSKEQVILGTIDRIAARVAERLGALSEKPESAADRLRQMLIDRVRLRGDSVRPYAKALEEIFAALRPQYLARRERYFQAEAAVIASVLRQGQRSGGNPRRLRRADSGPQRAQVAQLRDKLKNTEREVARLPPTERPSACAAAAPSIETQRRALAIFFMERLLL